jgi:hypothetical protein
MTTRKLKEIDPGVDWEVVTETMLRAVGVFPCAEKGARRARATLRRVVRIVRREMYDPTWTLQRQVSEMRLFGRKHPERRPYYWVLMEAIRQTHPEGTSIDVLTTEFDLYRDRLDACIESARQQRVAGD